MRLWFLPHIDDNPWPGPLEHKSAVLGEAWLGPMGLLSVFETQLGLTGRTVSGAVRTAGLVPTARAMEGFWSRSAQVDPFGVARELIHWRDNLCMQGWKGQGISPRLAELAKVTAELLPGVPDRLSQILAALKEQSTEIEHITILGQARDELPMLWQAVITQAETAGTIVEVRPVTSTTANGDLGRCREPQFEPVGDGSLQLLRPDGVVQAAEQVSAWLAAQHDLNRTVIIGSDVLLDDALRRHGLPTTGASASLGDNLLLQLVALVMELGRIPQDPSVALDLLLLPAGPVPHSIGNRLVGALQKWPAVDSDTWREVLTESLSGIENAEQRKKIQQRLESLLKGCVGTTTYPAEEVGNRLNVLVAWLQARLSSAAEEDKPQWGAAVAQCAQLSELCKLCGLPEFSTAQLQRITQDATDGVSSNQRYEAQAGIHRVNSPGSITGSAARIVWWNFVSESSEKVEQLPLTDEEIAALGKLGIAVPNLGYLAERLSVGWRRPFEQTEQALLLVCPFIGSGGDEQKPHPIWDEFTAMLKPESLSKIVLREPRGIVRDRKLKQLAIPRGRSAWELRKGINVDLPSTASPTVEGALVSCPFQWLLKYRVGLSRGGCSPLPSSFQLRGSLAHRIFENILTRICNKESLTPDQAREQAGYIFDTEGPRLAAELFAPGAEREKAAVRRSVVLSVYELLRQIAKGGATIVGVEEKLVGDLSGVKCSCRTDLLLDKPRAIVDLKWGGAKARQQELRDGTACQLAFYSRLAGSQGYYPPVAYFIINEQRLLCNDPRAFPDGEPVEGPPLCTTLDGFMQTYRDRCSQLVSGIIKAEFANKDETSTVSDGKLFIAPSCEYCDFRAFCTNGGEQ